jgi:phosphatidylserine/phosphatidylglycerophosphate/cardiolipin synthase-like enzyme
MVKPDDHETPHASPPTQVLIERRFAASASDGAGSAERSAALPHELGTVNLRLCTYAALHGPRGVRRSVLIKFTLASGSLAIAGAVQESFESESLAVHVPLRDQRVDFSRAPQQVLDAIARAVPESGPMRELVLDFGGVTREHVDPAHSTLPSALLDQPLFFVGLRQILDELQHDRAHVLGYEVAGSFHVADGSVAEGRDRDAIARLFARPDLGDAAAKLYNIYNYLGGDKGRFQGTAYEISDHNRVSALYQTPDLWGWDPSDQGYVPTAQNLLQGIEDLIGSATETVDIATLRPLPDGLFLNAIRRGLFKAAAKNPHLVFRVLMGAYPPYPDLNAELGAWLKALAPPPQMTVYAAASLSNTPHSSDWYISWNHAKLIIADRQRAICGGHNCWTREYCDLDPVHDVSMEVEGPAVAPAQQFLNLLWADVARNFRVFGVQRFSRMMRGGQIDPGALASITGMPRAAGGENVVLAVGRLGHGVVHHPEDFETDASKYARHQAVRLATKSIKLSQQMLDNKHGRRYWDEELLQELARAIMRGVDVSIVITAEGSADGYNGIGVEGTATKMRDVVADVSRKTGRELRAMLVERLHIAALHFYPLERVPPSSDRWKWLMRSGARHVPRNHAKVYIIDEELFYVGSDNAYPTGGLQEYGYLTTYWQTSPGAAPEAPIKSYWDSLWLYSSLNQYIWPAATSEAMQ